MIIVLVTLYTIILTVLINRTGMGSCSSSCWRTTASTSCVNTDFSWKHKLEAVREKQVVRVQKEKQKVKGEERNKRLVY